MNLIIIDTGCANLSSVQFAIQRLGYRPTISRDAAAIQQADKLFLPGVGTASAAMQQLTERNLIATIQAVQQPLLGICLGMQLLTAHSAEGNLATLGISNARTDRLPSCNLPLPHMGWNEVQHQGHPLFENIASDSHFYFVHSFAVLPHPDTIATCEYGVPFSAAIQHNNFYGVQFHPERSGKNGAQLLRNFVEHIV